MDCGIEEPHTMNVKIETVPHKSQRYPTVGDWYFDAKGNLTIKVSALGDWRFEMLVAVHELIEVLQCKNRGITQESVDWFDKGFEAGRRMMAPKSEVEPGEAKEAPYRDAHQFAEKVEEALAKKLDVIWSKYSDKVLSMP